MYYGVNINAGVLDESCTGPLNSVTLGDVDWRGRAGGILAAQVAKGGRTVRY